MDVLFGRLFEIFSLEYIFSVIMASYFVLKFIDALNGKRIVPTWAKRVTTFLVGAVLFIVFREYTQETVQCLLSSYLAAVFIYDTAIKVIIRKFNIDYRK